MTEMLQKFQLAVCSLRENGGREGLHDLLDGDGLSSQLVFGGAFTLGQLCLLRYKKDFRLPDESKGAHAYGL